jgi:hypothetical protein
MNQAYNPKSFAPESIDKRAAHRYLLKDDGEAKSGSIMDFGALFPCAEAPYVPQAP